MLSMLYYCECYLSIYVIHAILLRMLSINLCYPCYTIVNAIYQSMLSMLCYLIQYVNCCVGYAINRCFISGRFGQLLVTAIAFTITSFHSISGRFG